MSDVFDDEDVPQLPERVTTLLGRRETWAAPPDSLGDDVLAALRREREDVVGLAEPYQSSPEPTAEPPGELAAARDRRASRRGWSGGRLLAAAAVAAVSAVVAVGVLLVASPDRAGETLVALAPTELAPGASGRAEIRDTPSGFAIELDLEGLEPAPPGVYYQGWLKNDAGDQVTIGTFHGRDGSDDIVLWSGVDPAVYRTITVTVQREGDGPASSGDVVLRGTAG